jgi:uncharacterized protein (TIGR02996 family)
MTDHEALVRAVAAMPDADHPRLVLADWLEEEEGDAAQAEFIRTQVALNHVPPWDALSVRVRHRQPQLLTGTPWKHTLPHFGNGIAAEWNPDGPFRRGLGYSVHVRQLSTFLEMAPALLDVCPVQELILPGGTRDDWHALTTAAWFDKIRSVRFTFGSNLIEPVRAMAASPVTNLERVAFDVCTSPAMGVITEALVQSPVSKRLKALSFSVGSDTEGEIAEELANAELPCLEELAFKTMSLGDATWHALSHLHHTGRLVSLYVENQQFTSAGYDAFCQTVADLELDILHLRSCTCVEQEYIMELDQNYSQPYALSSRIMSRLKSFCTTKCDWMLEMPDSFRQWEHLRQLRFDSCHLTTKHFMILLGMAKWTSMVELDLSDNDIPDHVLVHMTEMELPDCLEALVLSVPEPRAARLRKRLGDRLVLR